MIDAALPLAVGLARHFESFRAAPYLDPIGIPTIGWGFTRYADGRVVTLLDRPIEPAAADSLLGTLMSDVLGSCVRLCPGADTPGRLAALADFTYNLGVGRLSASTLRRAVNSGAWGNVPAELRKWRLAGGRILPGLVLRREAEIALI